ncbi:VOC family protein [Streptomyces sp. NPDC048172]|uniref:VOC family protein n=1 Tax=Streptomyces sp. NPDC048172 TaxID=3365505 RepID=UPI00371B1E67
MPELLSYRPGELCWADLFTPEPAASERFYATLFDWEYVHAGAAFDHYTYAAAKGHMVAGITPSEDAEASWIVAFSTTSADDTAEQVSTAGGELEDGPRDFGIQGRSLFAVDSAGAHVGFWQPRAHMGAGLVGEPSSLCWAELAVRDTPAADRFYAEVLGLSSGALAAAGDAGYAAYHLEGREGPVAGRTVLGPEQRDVEPFWMPYFGVTDARWTEETATDGGASVIWSGANAEGRGVAVLADPWGATFAVLEVPSGP